MSHCTRRVLKRDSSVQQFTVPVDSKPVNFVNRSGDPTVYFACTADTEAAKKKTKTVKLLLTIGETPTPVPAEYIGTAEFGGGQFLQHAWMAKDA